MNSAGCLDLGIRRDKYTGINVNSSGPIARVCPLNKRYRIKENVCGARGSPGERRKILISSNNSTVSGANERCFRGAIFSQLEFAEF